MKPSSRGADSRGAPALQHPGRWLWLLLLLPIILGLARLRFDFEVFDLLPSDIPAVGGLKLYQEHFANARELVITIQGPNAEKTEAVAHSFADALHRAPDLVQTVTWQAPWLEHPEQSGELIGYLWFNQKPEVFSDLAKRLAPDKLTDTLNAAKEELATSMSPEQIGRLSYDPYGLTRLPESTASAAPSFGQGQELFSSADGTFRILFVQARGELRTYRECAKWLESVRKLIASELAKTSARPGEITIGYTGRPAFVTEIATGMQSDMTKSVGGTAAIIAVLFWLAHRRIKPMLWLLTLLAIILGSTLALGGLIFGHINVVSMGFAAILLGLAVDYAVVHYQEALAHPNLTIPQIRRAIAPSIFWAAVTTISAFLVLNFGGLPGLAQLGTMVGVGVGLAALIMIFEFLPPLFPQRNRPALDGAASLSNANEQPIEKQSPSPLHVKTVFALTAALAIAAAVVLCWGLPRIDPTAAPLRPRASAAYDTMQRVQSLLSQQREPLWIVVSGRTVPDVGHKLDQVQTVLSNAVSEGTFAGFNLPTMLWPRPEYQETNRPIARQLAAEGSLLRQAALTNGFTEQALTLTDRILATWSAAAATPPPFWPTNPMSTWIFEKLRARGPTNDFALGMVTASTNITRNILEQRLAQVQESLPDHTLLSGWELLGHSIFNRVQANLWRVLAPMIGLVLLSLYLAFRRPPEIFLSLVVLGLSGLCLLSVMRLAGWSWNLLNLMALPLVLGTGVDYSIFMQLALKREQGDVRQAYASVGRALLLCGGTAIAGFGSLAWSSNAGMASLGQLCAVGIGSNMLIAIFLLPIWWHTLRGGKSESSAPKAPIATLPTKPSILYCSALWRAGLIIVRVIPRRMLLVLGYGAADVYRLLARDRCMVVRQNLAPALSNHPANLNDTTKALFRNFARKVIDLWRYEASLDTSALLTNATGWEHFKEAQTQRRGILLLTPHLGNWEFGGPLLTSRGVTLQVLTLAEPGKDFTRLRQTSRARWNIETLVVGDDPMAFVEIIKRLEAGATVALLMDRPPPASSVPVNLFGHPFSASIAAAELARASGCVLLPVYIPWEENGYAAHMLPQIPYERAALRDRAARQKLTQHIVDIFEPIISQYPDQWYHFVPIWPGTKEE